MKDVFNHIIAVCSSCIDQSIVQEVVSSFIMHYIRKIIICSRFVDIFYGEGCAKSDPTLA